MQLDTLMDKPRQRLMLKEEAVDLFTLFFGRVNGWEGGMQSQAHMHYNSAAYGAYSKRGNTWYAVCNMQHAPKQASCALHRGRRLRAVVWGECRGGGASLRALQRTSQSCPPRCCALLP